MMVDTDQPPLEERPSILDVVHMHPIVRVVEPMIDSPVKSELGQDLEPPCLIGVDRPHITKVRSADAVDLGMR